MLRACCCLSVFFVAVSDVAGGEPRTSSPDKFEMPFVATNRDEAMAWQKQVRRRLFELVAAQAPRQLLAKQPLNLKIESSEDRDGYTLHYASFHGNEGEVCKCLLTMPKGAGPFPGMLCLHGHGGSAEMVFDGATVYRGFAERFARGGYCVLAPTFPHRTYAATRLWDLMRCVDLLTTQKGVDSQHIGVVGLSMGGEFAMWIAACDERVKVAVISGWMCTTKGIFSVPNCPCWQLPGFVELLDVCEVNLLIAPRPVLFESAEKDECFPIDYTRQGFARIQRGYKVFGAEGACAQDAFPGGHTFHGDGVYLFVDKILHGNVTGRPVTLPK